VQLWTLSDSKAFLPPKRKPTNQLLLILILLYSHQLTIASQLSLSGFFLSYIFHTNDIIPSICGGLWLTAFTQNVFKFPPNCSIYQYFIYFSCQITIHCNNCVYPSFDGSVQFSSVTQSCLTLCNPMNCSTPGLPVHHQLPEFTQTHIHQVSDAIQPSHHLLSPSPLALNLSQHQGLFKWVSSSHQVAKVLEFQLQH